MKAALMLTVMLAPVFAQSGHTIDPDLRQAVQRFLEAVDHGDAAAVRETYASDFLNVRVADDGGFVQLKGPQILSMLKSSAVAGIPAKETTIHYADVAGDMGFVLITRVKDLGSGWEPMFYSLVWTRQDGHWKLMREFVHQRTSPKRAPR